MTTTFTPGQAVRLISSPGFVGTFVRYFAPLPSGNVRVEIAWARNDAPTTVLASQIEAVR